MSIKTEQEVFADYYRYATDCLNKGDQSTARRALVCAISALMQVAGSASPDDKERFYKRIFALIKLTSEITDKSIATILTDIAKPNIGCSINLIENEAYVDKLLNRQTFDKVAGLDDVKLAIERQVINPIKYPKIFKRYNKDYGGGLLLYGLPGTGKTMIARAIASEIDADFFSIKCSDIVSKWFGESEHNIKRTFDEARNCRRAIIFFDEFESIASKRQEGDSGAMHRIVPELLAQIQGFENSDNSNILLIAATNRPWDIDSAFLRPGRFNRIIYVPLPDSNARRVIVSNAFKGAPIDESVDFDKIVEMTDGFSGADVYEFCDFAKNFAIEREIENKEKSSVTMGDIIATSTIIKSSIFHDDVVEMEKFMHSQQMAC